MMPYIILIIIFIAILTIVISKKEKLKEYKKITAKDIIEKNKQSYERKAFLTENERLFFNQLNKELPANYQLLAQVRLADIIQPRQIFPKKSNQYLALFRQISQWHVDYAVMNKENFNIEAVIELDDSSHQRASRQKRDKIFNEALKQAEIIAIRAKNFSEAKKQLMNINKTI